MLAAATTASPLIAQDAVKVAGIHSSPVENAWNSRPHEAMLEAAADGSVEYVFSEGVSGNDYARAMREYAEQGMDLIVGESYAVEREARQVAADYPDVAFLVRSLCSSLPASFADRAGQGHSIPVVPDGALCAVHCCAGDHGASC